jgi:hypothetical protein
MEDIYLFRLIVFIKVIALLKARHLAISSWEKIKSVGCTAGSDCSNSLSSSLQLLFYFYIRASEK